MLNNGRPFTPETLAERWECSPRHIRKLIGSGEIAAFRLGGKLVRIPAEEVERVERSADNVTEPQAGKIDPSLAAARLVRQTK